MIGLSMEERNSNVSRLALETVSLYRYRLAIECDETHRRRAYKAMKGVYSVEVVQRGLSPKHFY